MLNDILLLSPRGRHTGLMDMGTSGMRRNIRLSCLGKMGGMGSEMEKKRMWWIIMRELELGW